MLWTPAAGHSPGSRAHSGAAPEPFPSASEKDHQQQPRRGLKGGRALQLGVGRSASPAGHVRSELSLSEPGGKEGPERPGPCLHHRVPPAPGPWGREPTRQACERLCCYRCPRPARFPLRCRGEASGSSPAAPGALVRPRRALRTGPGGGSGLRRLATGRRFLGTGVPGERSCAWPPGRQLDWEPWPAERCPLHVDGPSVLYLFGVKTTPNGFFVIVTFLSHSTVCRLNVHPSFPPGMRF